MPEPGLSEIVNMTVDPERGTGTPAVVYDSKPLIAQLNQSAQYKAENDWRKYNVFLGNLKEVYKDLGEIAKMPVMTQDQPYLKEQMATILKEVSEDPKGFFGGGAKYQDVLGKISKLQSDATESKQNSAYDFAHRNYFYRNPELDTPENRQLIDSYGVQKLGTRQPYLMKLPALFDAKAMADQINATIKEDFQNEEASPDNQFLIKTFGTKYSPEKYRGVASQLYEEADKRGTPIRETIEKRYEQMPASVKERYADSKNPAKDWFLDLMDAYRMQDVTKQDRTQNPNYLEAEKLAEERRHNKASESIQLANLRKGGEEAENTKKQIGELYNRTLTTVFSPDSNSGIEYLQNVYGDNNGIEKSVTTENDNGDKTTTKVLVPSKQVIGSVYDPKAGTVTIEIKDNSVKSGWGKNNKGVTKKVIRVEDALVDFGRMFGNKYSPEQITSIATEYRKQKGWGDLKPDLEKMRSSFFGGGTVIPVTDPKLLQELEGK